MLKRLPLAAAFDEITERIRFHRRQYSLKIQIQLHARHLEQMSKQQVGLQARGLDTFFGKKFSAFLNRFEDGHATNLVLIRRMQSFLPDYFLSCVCTKRPT